MECMVCFETREMYQLKGCQHSICTICANDIKQLPSCIKQPFSNIITFTIPEKTTCLKCPYCRQDEPCQYNMDELQKKYPFKYKLWLEAEMKYLNGYTYITVTNTYKYGNSRKIYKQDKHYLYREGDIIDNICDLYPNHLKPGYHEVTQFQKNQIKQYKHYKVYKNQKFNIRK